MSTIIHSQLRSTINENKRNTTFLHVGIHRTHSQFKYDISWNFHNYTVLFWYLHSSRILHSVGRQLFADVSDNISVQFSTVKHFKCLSSPCKRQPDGSGNQQPRTLSCHKIRHTFSLGNYLTNWMNTRRKDKRKKGKENSKTETQTSLTQSKR
jgi:hypothetical protein